MNLSRPFRLGHDSMPGLLELSRLFKPGHDPMPGLIGEPISSFQDRS